MNSSINNLTQTEALAAGGILGGMLATVGIIGLVVSILLIIAWWKIFTKAGEAGWKSIIPIYNVYIFARIIKVNFWIFFLILPIICGIIGAINELAGTITTLIYCIFIDIYTSIRLAKTFKKGVGFIIGLIVFPNIFALILGFGSAKYDKKALEE